MSDEDLITKQYDQRLINHPYSMKSKAPLALPRSSPSIEVGDLVYIHSDRNKSRARDRYLVTSVDGAFCNVRKFIGSQLRSTVIASKSRSATMFLETSPKHTPLNVQTTPPGMNRTPLLKPHLLPRQRSRVQFLYQLISTYQRQKKMTFPWDQVPASLWTFPPTTPKRCSLFSLIVHIDQLRRSARQRRRPARYDDYVRDF